MNKHKVVIIGGGFAGLSAAMALGSANDIDVIMLDKRNFHLFQPLLSQIATGSLTESDIASPLRGVLVEHKNITTYETEVRHIGG